jgi:hypothetical protein
MVINKKLKATYTGELHIGDITLPCHVLENGNRVISGRGMQNSLGFSKAASGLALPQLVVKGTEGISSWQFLPSAPTNPQMKGMGIMTDFTCLQTMATAGTNKWFWKLPLLL